MPLALCIPAAPRAGVEGLMSACCATCRVTGRGYMDVNRISGYIPGKIVFFLMQAGRACAPLRGVGVTA